MRRQSGHGVLAGDRNPAKSLLRTGALLLFIAAACAAEAPPVEFGLQAIRDAVEERGLKQKVRIRAEIDSAEPESYRVTSYRVTGGDLRGLMYGLLEAAEQIRGQGRILPARGKPATPIRGIRRFLHNQDLEQDWYFSRDYWRDYIQMLARNRFNRLNLVFAHQTNYLAPPYPYWVSLENYPEVVVPGLSESDRTRNLETLCFIAQTAADHAVDFTLGIWQHDAQRNQTPTVEGLTPGNIGPYSNAALKKVLQACPAIRSVQFRTNSESGIPRERQVEFFRDHVFPALREAGRLVTLDLRGWLMDNGMLDAATGAGIPMRLSSKYWAEHLGRPYQPAETTPNYSYIDFLRRSNPTGTNGSRPYQFFWEIWALGSHRLLLWGDPDYVKRATPTLTMSDSAGFEIDAPLAQKGYGNRPGKWGIFAADQQKRKFWHWDFERYWFFYQAWGRLTYDPGTKDKLWINELTRRFGDAAPEVLNAYESASRVLSEIISVNMPDPNMYMWPEINPGGLIDLYRTTLPSDRRMIASFPEAVHARRDGEATAKQRPSETAERLRSLSDAIDNSIVKIKEFLGDDHAEWLGTEPDLRVLSHLARFHAHRQIGALRLSEFYETGEREALGAARRELTAALKVWEELAAFTSGLYPSSMAYGPEDYGHWNDKLPFLRHDLETLNEREWLFDRFGHMEFGFDFGPKTNRRWHHYSVEPRFKNVTAETTWDETCGYGWVTGGARREMSDLAISRGKVRATARNPRSLPENLLFGDRIEGAGPQVFRLRTGDGEFLVSFLLPDGNATTAPMNATNGVLDVTFPAEDWKVCGLIIKSTEPESPAPVPPAAERPDRPTIAHTLPRSVTAGTDLALSLRISPASSFNKVRLHYRPVNQLARFETVDAEGPHPKLTIPGEALSAEWDIMYYFEILRDDGSGWFHPNPEEHAPYYVLTVQPR